MKKMKTQQNLMILTMMVLGLFSSQLVAQTLNPPTNLTYTVADENDVTLFWNAPAPGGEPAWLHWDDGANSTGFGFFLSAETFEAAAKWDPSHLSAYEGWYITSMRFYMTSTSANLTMKIYTGSGPALQYTQAVGSFSANQWTEVAFTTPYLIDASTELWASLVVAQTFGGGPMGVDAGPAIVGYGDKIYHAGSWHDNSSYSGGDYNWNIQIYVSPTKSMASAELLGYNVYKDNTQINSSTVAVPSYVDMNLINGTYDYHVTAVYDEGESDTTNHVEVVIAQPVIANQDSMALVDLYNATDGPNWFNNGLWLLGPVNEWWGITTEGTRVTNVFMSNNSLDGYIPESFGNIDSLKSFHVSSNDITSLPNSIHKLDAMTEFWATNTLLTTLPDSFGYMESLYELSLGFNEINSLPESFGSLSNLYWFGMYDGGLTSLPSTFGNLNSLEILFLGQNEITILPDGIGDLPVISIIDLDYNNLTNLPESFGDLSTLTSFSADSNMLTTLPASFGNLSSLETLKLRMNQLESLSDNFGELSSLKSLGLSINNLTTLPASFPDLLFLEYLSADQNQLQELPENIGDLPSLKEMGLSYNEITSLPESFGDLDEMVEFFIVENQLESLPESIGDLEKIRRLAMGKNNFSIIPESIGNLSTLSYLDVSENIIEVLPDSLGSINPDTLFLFDNQIREIPESMLNNNFIILWMEDNFLQFGSIEPFISTSNYYYAPQGKIGQDTVITLDPGATLDYTIEVTGANNDYKWYKDGTLLSGQTTSTLYIENISAVDNGTYMLSVSNTLATELTLESHDMILNTTSVGLDENEVSEFNIYPNPVNGDIITIQLENTDIADRIIIRNVMGQVIKQIQSPDRQVQIQISDMPAGIYLINLFHGDKRKSMKLIRQ